MAALVEEGRAFGGEGTGPIGEARVFLARRSGSAGHGGKWELPGGKVEPGETPEAALAREIVEELGVGIRIEGPARRYESAIDGRSFVFIVFPSSFVSRSFTLSAHDTWRYFSASELGGLELAPLDGPALRDWTSTMLGKPGSLLL